MSKKASLVLSQDGTTANIVFSTGAESEIYESKNQVLRSLPALIKKKEITSDEADEIAKEVFKAEKLPNRTEEQGLFDFLFGNAFGSLGMHVSIVEISMPISSSVLRTFPEIESDMPVVRPIFRMCECGGNHAYILLEIEDDRIVVSPRIKSKYNALQLIKEAEDNGRLVKVEADRLIKEVEESALLKFGEGEEENKE